MSKQNKTEKSVQNKRLKILFVVRNFPTISETFIVNQIIYLINQGHCVRILSVNRTKSLLQNQIVEYNLMDRVQFIDMPENILKRFLKFVKLISLEGSYRNFKIIKLFNPFKYGVEAFNLSSFYKVSWIHRFHDDFDIVHAHFGFTSDIFFKAKEIGFFRNTKLVTSFHGHDMVISELNKNKKRYRELFKNSTVLTTNNEYAKDLILKIQPGYRFIHLLPVSLDTNLFKPISSRHTNIKIVYCGRLIYLKGPQLFIEIANQLINIRKIQNLQFEMIGDGKEKSRLEMLIKSYNLEAYVNLRGSLKQNEIITIFQNSDIFVSPGLTDINQRAETQGLVIQEAQAMKIPVLVSDAGGMKYGLIENKTGFVLPEGNIKSFCDKIEYLINNPLIRKKMGVQGRDYTINQFDLNYLGKKLETIYFNALEMDSF